MVRPARLRDLPALSHLERVCFGSDSWGLLGLLFTLLSPRNVNLLAENGTRVVGAVVGEPHLWQQHAIIASLAVHPDCRRRGLGTRLLAACEARLRNDTIMLIVRSSNQAAIALYEKHGYARAGVRPHYYSGGEGGLEMVKSREH